MRGPSRSGDGQRETTPEDRLRVSERAQLLLVGAVAVALIILGLVVVYNTILFTNTQEPTQSLDDTANSNRLKAQIVNDTQNLVNYVNNSTGNDCSTGSTAFTGDLEEYLTNSSNDGDKSIAKGLTLSNAKTGVRYVTIRNVNTDCTVGAADEVEIKMTLVVRTPETEFETEITEVYDPDP